MRDILMGCLQAPGREGTGRGAACLMKPACRALECGLSMQQSKSNRALAFGNRLAELKQASGQPSVNKYGSILSWHSQVEPQLLEA
jgi:hypothetical protein